MVLTKYHRDEFPDARKTFEAVHPPKREAPFRAAYTGVAADVLPWLRAQDVPVPPTALRAALDHGSWLPASVGLRVTPLAALKLPSRDLVEYQTAVSCAMHADYAMQLDTLAAIDSIAALAVDAHTVAMALAPVVALLDGAL